MYVCVYVLKSGNKAQYSTHTPVHTTRVATRPGFPGISRICAMLGKLKLTKEREKTKRMSVNTQKGLTVREDGAIAF